MLDQLPGISDVSAYLPRLRIDSQEVIEARTSEDGENGARMAGSLKYTGQKSIRFPAPYEDTVTLAAEATRRLIEQNPASLKGLRYLMTGTETGLDHSKPISAWVQGLLQKAGHEIPSGIVTGQYQHACAGGTLALLATAAQLAVAGRPDEGGLVICSDIARYQRASTAEITQGAGAVSLLVEPRARLVGLDLTSVGQASRDVDDFFRPLGSEVAVVKGKYSIRCYREALESAFLDHARRLGKTPASLLKETEIFVLHVPYYSLPLDSLVWLVGRQLGLGRQEAADFLAERGYQDSIANSALVGNLYTGSMYLALIYALELAKKRYDGDLAGRKILFGSYGSGNTMLVFSGVVASSANEVIESWKTASFLVDEIPASLLDYEHWMGERSLESVHEPRVGDFYLEGLREDGYREYALKT